MVVEVSITASGRVAVADLAMKSMSAAKASMGDKSSFYFSIEPIRFSLPWMLRFLLNRQDISYLTYW